MREVREGRSLWFYLSSKPRELFRHLLLMQKHVRDAVPDT